VRPCVSCFFGTMKRGRNLPIEPIPDSRQHRYGRHLCQFRALKKTLNAEAAETAEEATNIPPRLGASA